MSKGGMQLSAHIKQSSVDERERASLSRDFNSLRSLSTIRGSVGGLLAGDEERSPEHGKVNV